MKPEPVAQVAVKALVKGQRIVIPGCINQVSVFFLRLMPRCLVTSMTGKMVGR